MKRQVQNKDVLKSVIWRWLKNNIKDYGNGIDGLVDSIDKIYCEPENVGDIEIRQTLKQVDADELIANYCIKAKIPYNYLVSKNNKHKFSIPRHILAYYLWERTSLSFKEIGEKLGNRHHSTIFNSKRVTMELLSTGHCNAIEYDKICKEIIKEL